MDKIKEKYCFPSVADNQQHSTWINQRSGDHPGFLPGGTFHTKGRKGVPRIVPGSCRVAGKRWVLEEDEVAGTFKVEKWRRLERQRAPESSRGSPWVNLPNVGETPQGGVKGHCKLNNPWTHQGWKTKVQASKSGGVIAEHSTHSVVTSKRLCLRSRGKLAQSKAYFDLTLTKLSNKPWKEPT